MFITVGKTLKAIIEQNGETITSIAPKVGYTREHLSLRLRTNKVDEELLSAIATALNMGQDEFRRALNGMSQTKQPNDAEEVERLRYELDTARRTISDLSAAIRALSEKVN